MVRARKHAEAGDTAVAEAPEKDIFDEQKEFREQEKAARQEEDRKRAADQVIQQVADSTRMPEEPPVTGYLANPSSTKREPLIAEGHAGAVKKRSFKPLPDPTGMHTISLSDDPKGPKARLLRSQQHQDMWIQFTENPGEEIRGQLKEAGFTWQPRAHSDFARGAWVLELEQGREWQNHARAETVFLDIVNQLRAKNGMDEYLPMAQSR